MDGEIEENREAVRKFDITLAGLSCNKLHRQQRDAGKTMTDDELVLLTSLNAQRAALTFAHNVPKRAKNDITIKEINRALNTFDRSKKGDKKRNSLMVKQRKCGRQFTAE